MSSINAGRAIPGVSSRISTLSPVERMEIFDSLPNRIRVALSQCAFTIDVVTVRSLWVATFDEDYVMQMILNHNAHSIEMAYRERGLI